MPITLEQLQNDASELLADIRAEARGEGVAAERERATKILEAGGELQVATQAIKDGIKAEAAFELFFKAEKKKRLDALRDMETEAPESLGQGQPQDPPPEDNRRADEILAERCQNIMAEKGVSYEEAQKQVLAADPKLNKEMQKSLMPE